MVNFQKSCMTLSGRVAESEQHHLSVILGVRWAAQLDRYLGLPAVGGRSRSEMFNNIKEQIAERIGGWNSKLLSQAEKGVIIASVIQSMPSYVLLYLYSSYASLGPQQRIFGGIVGKRNEYIGWRGTNYVGQRRMGSMRECNLALLAKQGHILS
ncbi:UNVERIFIED_CONTAM: hypothetical protein Sradi_2385100 [Sesamum radiatum]|uniref:Reverse transcriptase n=1 Tax=Sesamum radiatum TaxID=300843 RepID=A0AAW2T748_SESRA